MQHSVMPTGAVQSKDHLLGEASTKPDLLKQRSIHYIYMSTSNMDQVTHHENYVADRPIAERSDDKFQRYEFSKRIAETIIQRKTAESIVFGLFGEWGEGKSSVLNFIQQELKSDPDVIQISLNPWRYSNEDSMLKSFFEKIAEVLEVKLYTTKEKIGKGITKLSKLTNIAGYDGSGLGSLLSDTEIEEFKQRVDQFLKDSNKKVVIFVDDIDRLDKQEIYALFRLVKLTADFSNTIYLLSFDEQMVAAAIAERYGSGDAKAGFSFLEKIIQIPLNLPKAQPEALKKFCFNLMEQAIDFVKLNISNDEMRRFVMQFTGNILLRLNTPRLAVRYSNTLSFSIPLLFGEANMVDLMLIEAVKIFYPDHYNLIKFNPKYFTTGFSDNDKSKEVFIKMLKDLDDKLTQAEQEAIRRLLGNLFPHVDRLFDNFRFSNHNTEKLYANKRIASADYFDRYYSYSVIDGEVSDIRFATFIASLEESTLDKVIADMRAILDKAQVGGFIQKLNVDQSELTWEQAQVIIEAICRCSELFPSDSSFFLGHGSPREQSAMFIYQLLRQHQPHVHNIIDFAKKLMEITNDFAFAYIINNWLRTGETIEEKLFDEKEYDEMGVILKNRAVAESREKTIFETHTEYIYYLVPIWLTKDKPGLKKYIKHYLDANTSNVINLLKAFTPTLTSLNGDNLKYKGDFGKEQFDFVKKVYSLNSIYQKAIKRYPLKEIAAEKAKWEQRRTVEFSEINLLRQFMRWYIGEKTTKGTK